MASPARPAAARRGRRPAWRGCSPASTASSSPAGRTWTRRATRPSRTRPSRRRAPTATTTELAIAPASAELRPAGARHLPRHAGHGGGGGGTLEQHVPERVGHDDHSPAPATYGTQPVDTVPGTRIAHWLGPRLDVPHYHHQSVLTHPGYAASAWAPDGTLEAMEDPGAAFRVAVQWHPEQGRTRDSSTRSWRPPRRMPLGGPTRHSDPSVHDPYPPSSVQFASARTATRREWDLRRCRDPG